MQARKKCEQCNTANEPNQIYCVNCGKYLKGKAIRKEDKLTIWGIDDFSVKMNPNGSVGQNSNICGTLKTTTTRDTKQMVVCPECSTETILLDGVLPLSCATCGYFFQAGIDKIVSSADRPGGYMNPDLKKDHKDISTDTKPHHVMDSIEKSPLQRVTKDSTTLRMTAVTSHHLLPETMKESGNIIGMNGTAFKGFQSKQQISIWHTAAGWYARATIGTPLYNGIPMNQGIQLKLSSGDLLVMDQEQFMLEII